MYSISVNAYKIIKIDFEEDALFSFNNTILFNEFILFNETLTSEGGLLTIQQNNIETFLANLKDRPEYYINKFGQEMYDEMLNVAKQMLV